MLTPASVSVQDKGVSNTSHMMSENNAQANEQVKHSFVSPTIAFEEACETWRLRCIFKIKALDA